LRHGVFYHNFCLLQHYKVVCVHTSGEVDSFNTHCSALPRLFAKFDGNLLTISYSKKLWAYFLWIWLEYTNDELWISLSLSVYFQRICKLL